MVELQNLSDEDERREYEAARLAALARFDFFEPEPGDILDRFARLAAQMFDTAYAALVFVEADDVRSIARHGLPPLRCPRRDSFFNETIDQDQIVWIADARAIEPIRRCVLVAEPPNIQFYAGAPLKTPDGFPIGVLCVMDPEPRPLADLATRSTLTDLAACTMSEMECWRLNRELEAATNERLEGARELDLIYESAPVGLSLVDRDLRFRRINHHLAGMDGKTIQEHIGQTVDEVLPDLAPILVPLYKSVLATGEPALDYEIVGQTPKEPGVERVWMGSYYPIPTADGRTGYVAAVVQEVTEARKMEVVERQNAKRLRRLLDGIGSLVGLLDADGTLLEANQTTLGVAGLTPEDVLGKPFEQTYWWSYSPTVQAQLRDAVERARTGETVRYDVPLRVGDGQFITIDFQLTPLYDDDGRVINLVPSAVDITERKAAEAALATSEALFRETFEQTAVGMAHISLDGRWLRVNDRLSEILGFSGDALQNRTFQEITYPQDLDADLENMRRLMAGEIDSYSLEKRCIRPSGSLTWVNSTVSLQRDAAGEPDHVIVVVEDIDARKAAEQRLATVMSELNHRVKNLLATMQTVVTHAARRAESKEQLVESVASRTRALANTHDILIQSQWQGAVISELVAEELRPYGPQRVRIDGLALWLTPKAALAFCLLVHELATNAAKYGALSGEAGHVAVRWTVTDTAEGETFRFVWEEHGGPAVTPPPARGFGSEIIEEIAPKELDGVSTLEFRPEGLRLTLEAPLQRMATSEELARDAERRRGGVAPAGDGAQRVLVVEDSAMIAMDLESFLMSAGYEVVGPASSVSEALALVDGEPLDAAFLDVDLEGELVTPVAAKLAEMGVPFAFLTGFDGASAEMQEFRDVIVVEKPFGDRLILSTLASLLASRLDESRT